MQAIHTPLPEAKDLSSKDRLLIGTLFAKENPDAAKNYLESYNIAKQKALDDDLHNVNFYFLFFCKCQSVDPFDYIGSLSKRDKIDKRRLFIGAMLRIFKPQYFSYDLQFDTGIGQTLCVVLRLDNGNLSKTIHEVKTWYTKNYCEFRGDVDELVTTLIDGKNGFGYGNLFKVKAV